MTAERGFAFWEFEENDELMAPCCAKSFWKYGFCQMRSMEDFSEMSQ